jgi:queuine tRNA-ribosyltransferase
MFTLEHVTPNGRSGLLQTPHGEVKTPFFMPVATAGAMKGITHDHLLELGAEIMLCNTYHLHLQPGDEIVNEAGGLHSFVNWKKPILTDSGGFQVFSLRGISKITEEGVKFQSHIDGRKLFIGPEESMRIQHHLGADIIMCFDHCPPSTANRREIQKAVDRTLRWAVECKRHHEALLKKHGRKIALFGIVQGGLERDLREKCAEELIAIGFDGYAVGGLAVGETPEEMFGVLDAVCPLLPSDKLRYLMGVGKSDQLRIAVSKGIDMFDCVLPMREARHGNLYLSDGSKIRITGEKFARDHSVIDEHSPSRLSREHTKSYLRHLLHAGERLGETIACLQNLGMTLQTMRDIRATIENTR